MLYCGVTCTNNPGVRACACACRQLEIMTNQRRRMLTWLRQADFEAYSYALAKLGLQDIYTPVVGAVLLMQCVVLLGSAALGSGG